MSLFLFLTPCIGIAMRFSCSTILQIMDFYIKICHHRISIIIYKRVSIEWNERLWSDGSLVIIVCARKHFIRCVNISFTVFFSLMNNSTVTILRFWCVFSLNNNNEFIIGKQQECVVTVTVSLLHFVSLMVVQFHFTLLIRLKAVFSLCIFVRFHLNLNIISWQMLSILDHDVFYFIHLLSYVFNVDHLKKWMIFLYCDW